MMHKAAILLVLLLGVDFASAQSEYFQQEANYDITVSLDDEQHVIHGFEKVVYTNNSPDTLHFLYFHLWPNAYSHRKSTHLAQQLITHGETTLLHAEESDLGFIDSLDFKVNGGATEWAILPDTVDVCRIQLSQPLHPGESVEISTPFRVKFPSATISRLGHTDQSYQVTQWYPKPAVYDRDGWHQMPYLNLGEFYSEYGSFDVHITLPDNYIVGATGDLQNEKEKEFLNLKAEETETWLKGLRSDEDFEGLSESDEHPASSYIKKTLHFHQENVHDFAWFADKRFRVLKGSVTLPHSEENVDVWSYFTEPNTETWSKSIEYLKDAIYYYSLWNGDYPYRHASAVDGVISAGGGMEYPNITVIGAVGGDLSLETVIMHEIGHNWFYGILGSNERDHPWMDEGMNTYNEQRYLTTKYPDGAMFFKEADKPLAKLGGLDVYELKEQHYFTYFLVGRRNMDQPINLTSEEFSMLNYGAIVYSKTGAMFNYLRHFLGDETMDLCMQAYFDTWKFKHPSPADLKVVFERVSGQNLDWFFDELLTNRTKVDFKITKAVPLEEGKTAVTVKNQSGLALPFSIGAFTPGELSETHWYGPIMDDTTIVVEHKVGQPISIDPNLVIPETRRDDNFARTRGILRRVETPKAHFVFKMEQPWKNQMYWAPVINYNAPSGFMAGLAFYNSVLPVKRLNYTLAPMYSFREQEIFGLGDIWYGITPESGSFQNIDLGVRAKRFRYFDDRLPFSNRSASFDYLRIEPYIRFRFWPVSQASKWRHTAELSAVYLNEDIVIHPFFDPNSLTDVQQESMFYRLKYRLAYSHPTLRFGMNMLAENYELFNRASLELNGRWTPKAPVIGRWRLFAGSFLGVSQLDGLGGRYGWQASGQTGASDYAYDGTFIDRSANNPTESFTQFMTSHSALKMPSNYFSTTWATGMNVELLSRSLPLGIFGDAVLGDFQGSPNGSIESFHADAGVFFMIGDGLFSIYAPILYTNSLGRPQDRFSNITDHLRFSLDLTRINVFARLRNIDII